MTLILSAQQFPIDVVDPPGPLKPGDPVCFDKHGFLVKCRHKEAVFFLPQTFTVTPDGWLVVDEQMVIWKGRP